MLEEAAMNDPGDAKITDTPISGPAIDDHRQTYPLIETSDCRKNSAKSKRYQGWI